MSTAATRPVWPTAPGHGVPARADATQTWQALRYFHVYRLLLAVLLYALARPEGPYHVLGRSAPDLFAATALIYAAVIALSMLAARGERPAFYWQVRATLLTDVLALTTLMLASGGMGSGLGMLLLVSVAGGSMLMSERGMLGSAGLAAAAVLAAELARQNFAPTPVSLLQAALLAGGLFATAFATHVLAGRARSSAALAEQRGLDLANLAQLNAYVIEHLQDGVVVVDGAGRVRLANAAAARLLQRPIAPGEPATALLPADPQHHTGAPADEHALHTLPGTPGVLMRCTPLSGAADGGAVVLLHDRARLAQQAQQIKLASLGRLTAAIAHEIRNPLGAISHAAQLLAEVPELGAQDQRLADIIRTQCQRMNGMIENVLQLSRREQQAPRDLLLSPWLQGFCVEFAEATHWPVGRIRMQVLPAELCVRVDPSHLHQILWNLCQNAERYGLPRDEDMLEIAAGIEPDFGRAFLDVADQGPGIERAIAEQMFEPFFTTARGGTGLGLYIVRELCELNGAEISYRHADPERKRFRILFRAAGGQTAA